MQLIYKDTIHFFWVDTTISTLNVQDFCCQPLPVILDN